MADDHSPIVENPSTSTSGSKIWKTRWRVIASALVVIGLAVAGFFVFKYVYQVPVPSVVGLSAAQATGAIEDAGLAIGERREEFSDAIPAGAVIRQEPLADARAARGSSVAISVSKGPAVTVPNVVGERRISAEQKLSDLGLDVAVEQQASETIPDGEVLAQSLEPLAVVARGSQVTINVSSGPAQVDVSATVSLRNFGRPLGFTSCGQIGLYFLVYYGYATLVADDGETVGRLRNSWSAQGNSVETCKVKGTFENVPTDRERYSLNLLPSAGNFDSGWKTRQQMIDANWEFQVNM